MVMIATCRKVMGLMRGYICKLYCDYVVVVQVELCLEYTVSCFKVKRESIWEQSTENLYVAKKVDIAGGWRQFYNKQLHILYSYFYTYVVLIMSREMRCARHIGWMRERRKDCNNTSKSWRGETSSFEENVNLHVNEKWSETANLINLAKDRKLGGLMFGLVKYRQIID